MSDEHVAVVTGSVKGIGRGIAERLARDGYRGVLNYRRDAAAAQEALNAVQSISPEYIALQADVATPEGAGHLITETHEMFGRLDVLVNNAGPFLVKTVF